MRWSERDAAVMTRAWYPLLYHRGSLRLVPTSGSYSPTRPTPPAILEYACVAFLICHVHSSGCDDRRGSLSSSGFTLEAFVENALDFLTFSSFFTGAG